MWLPNQEISQGTSGSRNGLASAAPQKGRIGRMQLQPLNMHSAAPARRVVCGHSFVVCSLNRPHSLANRRLRGLQMSVVGDLKAERRLRIPFPNVGCGR